MNKLKCRYCKQYSDRDKGVKVPLGFFCSIEHARLHGQEKAEKLRQKEAKRDLTKRKLEVMPISKLEDQAQAVINKYVRLRDRHKGCVSCSKESSWQGQWHCSHYFSQGNNSAIRFNLWNMHKSCSICNNHLSGNLVNYKPELINRIGQERFDELERIRYQPTRYSREYLQRIKKIFSKRCRVLEKRKNTLKDAA